MNAKEKADELIDKMYYIGRYDDKEDYNPAMAWARAKQCALIAVDEFLSFQENLYITKGSLAYQYWQKVKSELQSL